MSLKFQAITANFRGKLREETLCGVKYLVAPVTMIRQGVLAGSTGAIMYTNNKINRDIHRWNHVPLVLNHPEDRQGNKISARDPGVLEKYSLGMVFNTHFDKALRAEAWFNLDRTQKLAPEVLAQVRQRKQVELSTGLYTRTISANGKYKNQPYNQQLADYVPDHLAILVGEKGACSIKDGCGVNTNSAASPPKSQELSHDDVREAVQKLLRDLYPPAVGQDRYDYGGPYVSRMYPTKVVYRMKDAYYVQDYTVKGGEVSLSGEPTEVVSKTEFVAVKKSEKSIKFQPSVVVSNSLRFQPSVV